MITFKVLDILVLSLLGTGWTCCIFFVAIKYRIFNRIEMWLSSINHKAMNYILPFCYFCIGFWVCFLILLTFVTISHDSEIVALLASLAAAPIIRMLMMEFH